jgi:hypothetical protein
LSSDHGVPRRHIMDSSLITTLPKGSLRGTSVRRQDPFVGGGESSHSGASATSRCSIGLAQWDPYRTPDTNGPVIHTCVYVVASICSLCSPHSMLILHKCLGAASCLTEFSPSLLCLFRCLWTCLMASSNYWISLSPFFKSHF